MPTDTPNSSTERRMQLLERARRLRRTVFVGSLAFFAGFMALVVTHVTGVTARTAPQAPSQVVTPSQPAGGDGGFFNNNSTYNNYGTGGGVSSVPQYTPSVTRTRVS